jgi:outer membrane lipopolysaccharide assembly protein LptE/RlpB
MRRLAALLALGLATGGCGYSLRGTLPSHIRTVTIPVFANRTSEPAVENFLTSAVVEAFSTNGRLRVVNAARADSILEGEVVGYQIESVAFDAAANVRQYRLVVTLNLLYRDLREERVVFERRGVQERANFSVVGAVSDTIARQESALRTAAAEIARSIVSLTVEPF